MCSVLEKNKRRKRNLFTLLVNLGTQIMHIICHLLIKMIFFFILFISLLKLELDKNCGQIVLLHRAIEISHCVK